LQADQLLPERSHPINVRAAPTKVDPHIAAVGPTQARKRLSERGNVSLPQGIGFVVGHEHADAPHAVALLGARRECPRRSGAEPGDEVAPSKANAHLPLPWRKPIEAEYHGPTGRSLTFRRANGEVLGLPRMGATGWMGPFRAGSEAS
jgi:hypothetical protein